MSITKKSFGFMPDGTEVFSYTLDNNKNLKAEILSYGGIIKNLWVKDNKGEYTDVVLGADTLEAYLEDCASLGAAVGRYANRIGKGKFSIDGIDYNVTINNGPNCLHGGNRGFSKYVWNVVEAGTDSEPALVMTMVSPDNDEGFPGTLSVKMTYTLSQNDGLVIHYEAECDKSTVVNLTNHSYFNLNGHANENICNLKLQLNADFYTPNTSECIPSGEIYSVAGTPFDLTEEKVLKDCINSDFEQIKMFGGFDHNFIIRGKGLRPFGTLSSDKTGIHMEVFSNKPGVQIYTSNALESDKKLKNGVIYKNHDAVCLETQHYPNSTTFSHFPSPILKKGEKYDFTTEYRFSIK